MDEQSNIRAVMELIGTSGPLAQGANGELLVSINRAELGCVLTTAISSLSSVTVGSMPNLTIAALPNVTVASMPALTAESAKGVGRAGGGVIATAAGTIYTASEKRRNGKIVIAPIISEGQVVNVWHVPSGLSRGDAYLLGRYVLAADAAPVTIENIGWAAGDKIDAELPTGTTQKCTLTVYGESY